MSSIQFNTLIPHSKKCTGWGLNLRLQVNSDFFLITANATPDRTCDNLVYFWQCGDKFPIAEPKAIMVAEDILE